MRTAPAFTPITSPCNTKSTLRNGVGPGRGVKGRASVMNTLGKRLFQNSGTWWGSEGSGECGALWQGEGRRQNKSLKKYFFSVSFHFPSGYCILRCQKERWWSQSWVGSQTCGSGEVGAISSIRPLGHLSHQPGPRSMCGWQMKLLGSHWPEKRAYGRRDRLHHLQVQRLSETLRLCIFL